MYSVDAKVFVIIALYKLQMLKKFLYIWCIK